MQLVEEGKGGSPVTGGSTLPVGTTGGLQTSAFRRDGLHDPRMSRLARAQRASDGNGPLVRVHADVAEHDDSAQIRPPCTLR